MSLSVHAWQLRRGGYMRDLMPWRAYIRRHNHHRHPNHDQQPVHQHTAACPPAHSSSTQQVTPKDEKGKHVPSGPRLFRIAQLAIAQWKRAHSGDSGAGQAVVSFAHAKLGHLVQSPHSQAAVAAGGYKWLARCRCNVRKG
ncbi:hypothetical protein HaLaN_04404 [Haematococcus lacustris]|uniref:Uncharacterized protein n=1 Tax=Haematococcus lacustris TaxID=44745 RepID=A0A699YR93_HAELA|nr:hypothetical protein HaLaN_04404 [Haematococcus lacustris]